MHVFLSSAIFFQNKLGFFRSTIKVSNSLDPDQAQHLVVSDLGPTCLQMLSAPDTSKKANICDNCKNDDDFRLY